jgi:hypothetical protein
MYFSPDGGRSITFSMSFEKLISSSLAGDPAITSRFYSPVAHRWLAAEILMWS